MQVMTTSIEGVFIVESERFTDQRGSFSRLFCDRELSGILEERQVVQINHSLTVKAGAIRGMHFQHPPQAEMKLIRCTKGKVYDVAVDLRKGSKTFLKWHAQILTPEDNIMFIIPEGCAHGFQTLEADSELLYLHTCHYEPDFEAGVLFDDPMLKIEWPLACTDISLKDSQHPRINAGFSGILL